MNVRGKFKVTKHVKHAQDNSYVEIELDAQYSQTAEDNTYAKSTPTGHITMTVTVPAVVEAMPIGQSFYVDFSAAD